MSYRKNHDDIEYNKGHEHWKDALKGALEWVSFCPRHAGYFLGCGPVNVLTCLFRYFVDRGRKSKGKPEMEWSRASVFGIHTEDDDLDANISVVFSCLMWIAISMFVPIIVFVPSADEAGEGQPQCELEAAR